MGRSATLICLLLLAGCSRCPPAAGTRTNARQQKMALAGMNRLHDAFNCDACQSIHDEADIQFHSYDPAWIGPLQAAPPEPR